MKLTQKDQTSTVRIVKKMIAMAGVVQSLILHLLLLPQVLVTPKLVQ